MILAWLIIIPMAGGLAAWLAGFKGPSWARLVALATMVLELAVVVAFWCGLGGRAIATTDWPWLAQLRVPWIEVLNIDFHLGMDGLSLLMVAMTAFVGVLAVAASWRGVASRVGFFQFNLLWSLAGVIGVFLALDLFLLYAFWELMLVPLYFLIGLWGDERRTYATIKFFLFTQAGGLAMLLAILGLYFHYGQRTHEPTMSYLDLVGTSISPHLAMLLMLGFFAAFAVKLPAVGVHTWLVDAHAQAPTNGSADIAGLVVKVGAYGLLRFVVPLFPVAAMELRGWGMILGVVGILYGGLMAFGQRDLKRLAAYIGISHMGFVLLGVAAWTQISLQGVVMVIIASGIGSAAMFVLIGIIYDRLGTRDMTALGGLWAAMPRLGGWAMFFAMAALGLPALAGFVGEVLVLIGLAQAGAGAVGTVCVVLGACGFVVSVIYALWFVQRVFQGPLSGLAAGAKVRDLSPRETAMLAAAAAVVLWLGIYPKSVLDVSDPAIWHMRTKAMQSLGVFEDSPVAQANSGRAAVAMNDRENVPVAAEIGCVAGPGFSRGTKAPHPCPSPAELDTESPVGPVTAGEGLREGDACLPPVNRGPVTQQRMPSLPSRTVENSRVAQPGFATVPPVLAKEANHDR